MKLDKAAAAYEAAHRKYTIAALGAERYRVTGPNAQIEWPELSYDDAVAMRDQEAGRAAVIAALREIISPDVLSRAAHHAGCTLRKFENNQINNGRKPSLALLEGLLVTLEEDANG